MVLDPIPQSLPVHFFGSRPQPPTSLPLVPQMSHFAHINQSWHKWVKAHVWMSHSISFTNESCRTCQSVMAQMSNRTHMNESWHKNTWVRSVIDNYAIGIEQGTYKGVMAHLWMSHVTHLHESCHTYEWVMAHIWMSHVTHMNESWHTYEWVIAHLWMSHVTHLLESCHTREWVMLHTKHESCCAYEWAMSHL